MRAPATWAHFLIGQRPGNGRARPPGQGRSGGVAVMGAVLSCCKVILYILLLLCGAARAAHLDGVISVADPLPLTSGRQVTFWKRIFARGFPSMITEKGFTLKYKPCTDTGKQPSTRPQRLTFDEDKACSHVPLLSWGTYRQCIKFCVPGKDSEEGKENIEKRTLPDAVQIRNAIFKHAKTIDATANAFPFRLAIPMGPQTLDLLEDDAIVKMHLMKCSCSHLACPYRRADLPYLRVSLRDLTIEKELVLPLDPLMTMSIRGHSFFLALYGFSRMGGGGLGRLTKALSATSDVVVKGAILLGRSDTPVTVVHRLSRDNPFRRLDNPLMLETLPVEKSHQQILYPDATTVFLQGQLIVFKMLKPVTFNVEYLKERFSNQPHFNIDYTKRQVEVRLMEENFRISYAGVARISDDGLEVYTSCQGLPNGIYKAIISNGVGAESIETRPFIRVSNGHVVSPSHGDVIKMREPFDLVFENVDAHCFPRFEIYLSLDQAAPVFTGEAKEIPAAQNFGMVPLSLLKGLRSKLQATLNEKGQVRIRLKIDQVPAHLHGRNHFRLHVVGFKPQAEPKPVVEFKTITPPSRLIMAVSDLFTVTDTHSPNRSHATLVPVTELVTLDACSGTNDLPVAGYFDLGTGGFGAHLDVLKLAQDFHSLFPAEHHIPKKSDDFNAKTPRVCHDPAIEVTGKISDPKITILPRRLLKRKRETSPHPKEPHSKVPAFSVPLGQTGASHRPSPDFNPQSSLLSTGSLRRNSGSGLGDTETSFSDNLIEEIINAAKAALLEEHANGGPDGTF